MNDKPLACSLSAGELESRLAEIEGIGADSLLSHRQEGAAHVLRFRGDSGTRQRLEAVLAAERQCCPFLELNLAHEGEHLVLSIAAPAEAAPVAAELAASFRR